MADSSPVVTPPEPPEEPAAAPAPARRRWDWRPKLRWFAAEIVVVVAGVLIAFAINAWWSGQVEQARVSAAIENVAAEVAANLEELRHTARASRSRAATLSRFLARSPDEVRQLPRDSLVEIRTALVRPRTYDPGGGAMDGLLGGGDFAAVRDLALRERLVAWQRLADEIEEDYESASTLSRTIRAAIAEHGIDLAFLANRADGAWNAPSLGEAFAAFRADARASGYAAQLFYEHRGYANELAEFIPEGEALAEELARTR